MKINIDKVGSRNYYDELLYVANNYKKFIRKPRSKAKLQSKTIYVWVCLILAIMVGFIVLYFSERKTSHLYIVGLYMLILGCALYYLGLINKRINFYLNEDVSKVIDINKDEIGYDDTKQKMSIKWSEIAYVIISKYSICFLPKEPTNVFISISKDYLDQVLKGIEESGHSDLVIDNSNL